MAIYEFGGEGNRWTWPLPFGKKLGIKNKAEVAAPQKDEKVPVEKSPEPLVVEVEPEVSTPAEIPPTSEPEDEKTFEPKLKGRRRA